MFGVGDQVVKPAPEGAEADDAGALEVERGGGDVPALVLLAQEVLAGNDNVLEERLVEARATGHLVDGSVADPRRPHIYCKVRDAPVLGRVGIGAGQKVYPVGVGGAGGPYLLPVDDVVIAGPPRPGLN